MEERLETLTRELNKSVNNTTLKNKRMAFQPFLSLNNTQHTTHKRNQSPHQPTRISPMLKLSLMIKIKKNPHPHPLIHLGENNLNQNPKPLILLRGIPPPLLKIESQLLPPLTFSKRIEQKLDSGQLKQNTLLLGPHQRI